MSEIGENSEFNYDIPAIRYRKQSHSMTTKPIIEALDGLCDALQLGRSESATERLFLILAETFNEDAANDMDALRLRSHDDGLCFDMRGPMARRILQTRIDLCGEDRLTSEQEIS